MPGVSHKELSDIDREMTRLVSAAVRGIAFGTIAAVWAVFSTTSITWSPTAAFGVQTSVYISFAFALAIASLMTDLLHYICGVRMSRIALQWWDDRIDAENSTEFCYNESCLGKNGMSWYNWIPRLFWTKLVLSIGSGAAFLLAVFEIRFGPQLLPL